MANGNKQASGGVFVAVAFVVAAPFLLSPLYVSSLAPAEQKLAEQVDPGVNEALASLQLVDESLLRVSDLRQRLSGAGADLSAQSAAKAAEDDEDLFKPIEAGALAADRILAASEQMALDTAGSVGGPANVKGIGGRGASFAQKSFNELTSLVKKNDGLIQAAETAVKAAMAAPSFGELNAQQHLWANRAAAMVALAKGRTSRDHAWLDRWQAESLRQLAVQQAMQAADLRRMADASGGRTPTKAIEEATKRQTALKKAGEDLRDQAGKLKAAVDAQKAKIAAMIEIARTSRDAMAKMELKPFKAADSMKAGEQFKKYRQEYERLSATAREAESQAESLRSGALLGGELAADADGDLLNGAYSGAKAGEGLLTMEARLTELEQRAAAIEADASSTKDELAALNATAQKLDGEKAALNTAADEQAAAARKTMDQIAALAASAAKSEAAAVAAFDGGMRYTQAAQTAAKKRVSVAKTIEQEAAAEKTAERLAQVISDKDTEASVVTMAAELAWSAAETYAQGIAGATAQQRFLAAQASLLGGEAAEETNPQIDAWRKAGLDKLTLAAQQLSAAKLLIAGATFEGLDGFRLVGANYKWQVSQLEAGIHLLAANLADTPETMKDALAKARTALHEAVTGRESSPRLATAVEALKAIQ